MKTKEANLDVVISSDLNYLQHCYVLAQSVIDSNSNDFETIRFHLLSNSIPQKELICYQSFLDHKGASLKIYDISDIETRLGVKIPSTISISAYSRLFIPSIIEDNDIHRLIYMDVDGVNVSSLKNLYEINIEDTAVGGVLDDTSLQSKIKIGLSPTDPYINSGFLLINLDYWRKHNLQTKFLKFLHAHHGNVFHHDQGIINAVCNSTMRILSPNYNMVSNFFSQEFEAFKQTPFYTKSEIENGKTNPIFIHFTPGVVKRPWIKKCKHPLVGRYLEFRNQTPIGDHPLEDDNRPFKIKFLSWTFFNCRPLYSAILKIRSKISNKI